MEKKFIENQSVRLIGENRKMRVVRYLTKKEKSNRINPFNLPREEKDTGILTGKVECTWSMNQREHWGDFDESNLESCD
jgi:hypothetical protein